MFAGYTIQRGLSPPTPQDHTEVCWTWDFFYGQYGCAQQKCWRLAKTLWKHFWTRKVNTQCNAWSWFSIEVCFSPLRCVIFYLYCCVPDTLARAPRPCCAKCCANRRWKKSMQMHLKPVVLILRWLWFIIGNKVSRAGHCNMKISS